LTKNTSITAITALQYSFTNAVNFDEVHYRDVTKSQTTPVRYFMTYTLSPYLYNGV